VKQTIRNNVLQQSSKYISLCGKTKNDSNKQLPQNTCIDERNTNGKTAEAKHC
jgi:predicted secreted Zn-dependent protease